MGTQLSAEVGSKGGLLKQTVDMEFQVPHAEAVNKVREYFGLSAGGPDLLGALRALPEDALRAASAGVEEVRRKSGRVFVMGNGGSFDNARAIAELFDRLGVPSRTPGRAERYFSGDYAEIFLDGLKAEGLSAADLVVGLSGSGNSPNIVRALEYAKTKGASVLALGGRDGGRMKEVAGSAASIIARTENMEAIEDVHYAVGIMIAETLKPDGLQSDAKTSFVSALEEDVKAGSVERIADVALDIIRTIYREGTLFILGAGIGANHFRADAGRGFTNCLPLRGVYAPEFFSTNSAMATANDDGPRFILADGLAKMRISPEKDFALLIAFGQSADERKLLTELLGDVPVGVIGGAEAALQFPRLAKFDPEFVVSMVGHCCGVTIRETLWRRWGVRALSRDVVGDVDFRGQRKPAFEETRALEEALRQSGVLTNDEVITFAYGAPYAALNPERVGLSRVHY